MGKPRVFIGSSTEGLRMAEAVFAHLQRDTIPTLWTNEIFLPGHYPMEVLERELKRHSFAILVASPDDEVVKRGAAAPVMRDNLLLEFGLFTGALGRRRAFFIVPSSPKLDIPSDLIGIVTASYDSTRLTADGSELAAALQHPCQQVRTVILEEWALIVRREEDLAARIRATEESKAVERLHTVASRLRDSLIAVQRDAFAAFSDRAAFEDAKRRAADEIAGISLALQSDAKAIGVETQLVALQAVSNDALLDLPFPEELSVRREIATQRAMNIGFGALNEFLRGGDPVQHARAAVGQEAEGRLSSLGRRYSIWWDKHAPLLQSATAQMQDALFNVMIKLSSLQVRQDEGR